MADSPRAQHHRHRHGAGSQSAISLGSPTLAEHEQPPQTTGHYHDAQNSFGHNHNQHTPKTEQQQQHQASQAGGDDCRPGRDPSLSPAQGTTNIVSAAHTPASEAASSTGGGGHGSETSSSWNEPALSASDYFFVTYPFAGEGCAGDTTTCPCGDECQCLGCSIHNSDITVGVGALPVGASMPVSASMQSTTSTAAGQGTVGGTANTAAGGHGVADGASADSVNRANGDESVDGVMRAVGSAADDPKPLKSVLSPSPADHLRDGDLEEQDRNATASAALATAVVVGGP